MVGPLSCIKTGINALRHSRRSGRALEIGPGAERLPGFETLNILPGKNVDYVWDASRRLPFFANTFHLIYASHVLEHIPWYHTELVLADWVRVLQPGGRLEVWVPDALKICAAFVDYETHGEDRTHLDGWYRFNPGKDPCKWASGRIFTYGDGRRDIGHPNWHHALFSPRYLTAALAQAGLVDITALEPKDVRGYDHGWINLGMRGTKP